MLNAASVDAAVGVLRASPGFVLPTSAFIRPVHEERDELMNRLMRIKVMIPGAQRMELSELRDLVQWQEERHAVDIQKALWRPANRPKKLTREQVQTGLREYLAFIRPRMEGRQRIYQASGVTALEG
jgi:hypothetical protein